MGAAREGVVCARTARPSVRTVGDPTAQGRMPARPRGRPDSVPGCEGLRPPSGRSRGLRSPRRFLRSRTRPPRGERWGAGPRLRRWLNLVRRGWRSRGSAVVLGVLVSSFPLSGGYGGKKRNAVREKVPEGWIASIHEHLLRAERDVLLLVKEKERLSEIAKQDIEELCECLAGEIQRLYETLGVKGAARLEIQLEILSASQKLSANLWTYLAGISENRDMSLYILEE